MVANLRRCLHYHINVPFVCNLNMYAFFFEIIIFLYSCSNTMDVTMVTRVGTLFAQFECASQLS